MKRIINIMLMCAGIVLNASAQTFTQRIQNTTQGNGTVTVHHTKAVDDLVNGPSSNVVQKKTTSTTVATTPATTKTPVTKKEDSKTQGTTPQPMASISANDTLSAKNARSFKTIGFRVQVFAGGNSRKDKQKAEQTGNELRALFPQEPVYVHFISPRWICRMGNYRTQEEAHQALQEVRKLGYEAATIVKGKITVRY